MFDFLKKKVFGEEVYTAWVPSLVRMAVYVWKRNDEYTLRIWSERGSYSRGMTGNHTALWFEPSEVKGLIEAIVDANEQMTKMMQKG